MPLAGMHTIVSHQVPSDGACQPRAARKLSLG